MIFVPFLSVWQCPLQCCPSDDVGPSNRESQSVQREVAGTGVLGQLSLIELTGCLLYSSNCCWSISHSNCVLWISAVSLCCSCSCWKASVPLSMATQCSSSDFASKPANRIFSSLLRCSCCESEDTLAARIWLLWVQQADYHNALDAWLSYLLNRFVLLWKWVEALL